MTQPETIAREYFDSWNKRDFTRIRQLLHPDYSYTGGDGRLQKGPDAGVRMAQMWASALPDGKIDVRHIFAAGKDAAVTEFIGRGTQTGQLLDIAPTGRQLTVPVCNVIEIRDGKVFAEREYMDMLHVLQQLGVARVPATV